MKKIIISIWITLCFCFITGCANESNDYSADKKAYSFLELSLSNDYDTEMVYSAAATEDTAVFALKSLSDKSCFELYSFHVTDDTIQDKELFRPSGIAQTDLIYDMAFDKNGRLYLFCSNANKTDYYIDIYNISDGTDKKLNIGSYIEEHIDEDRLSVNIDINENIFLTGVYNTYVFSHDGHLLYSENDMSKIQVIVGDKNGILHIFRFGNSADWSSYVFDHAIANLSKDRSKWSKHVKDILNSTLYTSSGHGAYDFFYMETDQQTGTGKNIVGYENGSRHVLCEIDKTGLMGEHCLDLHAMNSGVFSIIYTDEYGRNRAGILIPCNADTKEMAKKDSNDKITFVGINIDSKIKNAVYNFNKLNTDQIEIIDYAGIYNDMNEARKQFYFRTAAGEKYDIVCLNDFIDPNILMEKGLLCNIRTYIDNSNVLQKEDFIPCISKELYKDAVYEIVPEFSIKSFLVKNKNLGSLDRFLSAADTKHTENDEEFFYSGDNNALLYDLLCYNPNHLINTDAEKSVINEEYLYSILNAVNSSNMIDTDDISIPEAVKKDKASVFPLEIDSILDYMLFLKMFEGQMKVYGMPTEFGNRPVICCNCGSLAILTQSDHKDVAFDFLEYILSKDNYDKLFGKEYFPIRSDVMESDIKRMSALSPYVEDGMEIPAVNGNYEVGFDEYVISPEALTETEIAGLQEILNNSIYINRIKSDYMNIILEEAADYFSGNQTAESAVTNTNARVSLAFHESQ